ncbi:MAG: hypothetical protein M5R36_07435 [Deltaproteobacteria bacterium]|nr:hypothetical protein [Deltaproteobacteria bacterium]
MRRVGLAVLTVAFLVFAAPAGAVEFYLEDFQPGFPGGWTVIDNSGDGQEWESGPFVFPWWNYITGGFAFAYGFSFDDADTTLISNEIDASAYTDVSVTIDSEFVSEVFVPDNAEG